MKKIHSSDITIETVGDTGKFALKVDGENQGFYDTKEAADQAKAELEGSSGSSGGLFSIKELSSSMVEEPIPILEQDGWTLYKYPGGHYLDAPEIMDFGESMRVSFWENSKGETKASYDFPEYVPDAVKGAILDYGIGYLAEENSRKEAARNDRAKVRDEAMGEGQIKSSVPKGKKVQSGSSINTRIKGTIEGYLEAILFTESEELEGMSIYDFGEEARIIAGEACGRFLLKADTILDQADTSDDQIGHDFWLTRNGHGAGFWDSPELYGGKDNADALTEIADGFGYSEAYLGDDGTIMISDVRLENMTVQSKADKVNSGYWDERRGPNGYETGDSLVQQGIEEDSEGNPIDDIDGKYRYNKSTDSYDRIDQSISNKKVSEDMSITRILSAAASFGISIKSAKSTNDLLPLADELTELFTELNSHGDQAKASRVKKLRNEILNLYGIEVAYYEKQKANGEVSNQGEEIMESKKEIFKAFKASSNYLAKLESKKIKFAKLTSAFPIFSEEDTENPVDELEQGSLVLVVTPDSGEVFISPDGENFTEVEISEGDFEEEEEVSEDSIFDDEFEEASFGNKMEGFSSMSASKQRLKSDSDVNTLGLHGNVKDAAKNEDGVPTHDRDGQVDPSGLADTPLPQAPEEPDTPANNAFGLTDEIGDSPGSVAGFVDDGKLPGSDAAAIKVTKVSEDGSVDADILAFSGKGNIGFASKILSFTIPNGEKVLQGVSIYANEYQLVSGKAWSQIKQAILSKAKAKKSVMSGVSNNKEVSKRIQETILEYFDSYEDMMRELENAVEIFGPGWKAGMGLAEGGTFAVYTDDQRAEIAGWLEQDPKEAERFSDDKVFHTYVSLMGREVSNILGNKNYIKPKDGGKKGTVAEDDTQGIDQGVIEQSINVKSATSAKINKTFVNVSEKKAYIVKSGKFCTACVKAPLIVSSTKGAEYVTFVKIGDSYLSNKGYMFSATKLRSMGYPQYVVIANDTKNRANFFSKKSLKVGNYLDTVLSDIDTKYFNRVVSAYNNKLRETSRNISKLMKSNKDLHARLQAQVQQLRMTNKNLVNQQRKLQESLENQKKVNTNLVRSQQQKRVVQIQEDPIQSKRVSDRAELLASMYS
jgi:hypothetical protein